MSIIVETGYDELLVRKSKWNEEGEFKYSTNYPASAFLGSRKNKFSSLQSFLNYVYKKGIADTDIKMVFHWELEDEFEKVQIPPKGFPEGAIMIFTTGDRSWDFNSFDCCKPPTYSNE
jgi:hypothetical protein